MQQFFERCPAFYVGLFLLLGVASHFAWHPLYLAFLVVLLFPMRNSKKWMGYLLLALSAYCITAIRFPSIAMPQNALEGKGRFSATRVAYARGAFHRFTVYEGTLRFTSTAGQRLPTISCRIFSPSHVHPADRDYIIEGTLVQNRPGEYTLHPKKRSPWQALPKTFCFAEWRFHAKRALGTFIKHHIHDKNAAAFLTALFTGDVEERSLKIELNRLGISHLIAISGFHFALIALFLETLLRFILPFKARLLAMLFLLSGYFLFLGVAPSIMRAYIAISLYLLGKFLGKRITGCNALGVGLCVECLIDPHVITSLSFQLSFSCTIAILLLYQPVHAFLAKWLPERTPAAISEMPLFHQHGYILLSLLRKGLALNLSVHLFSVPILLYYFHKFPMASLSYNLFIPFLTGIACIFLLLALCLSPLPLLPNGFFWLAEMVTTSILTFTTNAPLSLQWTLRTQLLSFPWVLFLLSLLFLLGMHQTQQHDFRRFSPRG